jgi:acyl-CoA reductase-like NAD-dependent aldehyde dehydrogenase
MDASARGTLLYKLADLVERDRKQLAALESLDNGKPFAMADAVDVDLAIKCLRYYAGWSDKQYGKVASIDGPFLAYTRCEAIGVVGAITPWNFPLLMCMWKAAPALCMGNCIILKPAEQTPLSALHFAALVGEAGFPPGVFNVVPGYGPTAGAALVAHPLVEKIAFTGSTEVGRIIQREAAGTLKRVTLELGGKSPLIVCADADIDVAVETAHSGIFFNSGQVCCASSRVFVHASIYDAFLAKSALRAKARTVGDGFSGAEQGPQVDKDQLDRVLGYIAAGKAEGATVVAGGAQHGTVGYFVQPTIFGDVRDDMKVREQGGGREAGAPAPRLARRRAAQPPRRLSPRFLLFRSPRRRFSAPSWPC